MKKNNLINFDHKHRLGFLQIFDEAFSEITAISLL